MKKSSFILSFLLCMSAVYNAQCKEISTNAALMQAMDKVTGRVNKITVPVNSKITFGDFSLVLRACKKRPAEETPENFAFVDVADRSFGTEEYNIFRGWLISSTPGINAIAHPIYDVWLLECIDTDVDKSKLMTEEELAQRDSLPTKETIKGQTKSDNEAEAVAEPEAVKEEKVIKIQEFMQQDRDIEKDIKTMPAYISESSTSYVSEIEEGAEPQNLLQFTKMQEKADVNSSGENAEIPVEDKSAQSEDDLSDAIDAELEGLNR